MVKKIGKGVRKFIGRDQVNHCSSLLEQQGFRGSGYEYFKILSVTGGIPWYLEQIQGKLSADENIQRQCFTKGGVLVEEFGRIFYEIFGKRDRNYKALIEAIACGPADYETISKRSGYQSSGRLSEYLEDLTKAGFIARDYTWSIKSKKESRLSLYRLSTGYFLETISSCAFIIFPFLLTHSTLSMGFVVQENLSLPRLLLVFQKMSCTKLYRLKDNYLRFFLKYIGPRLNQIDKGRLSSLALSSLKGWESIPKQLQKLEFCQSQRPRFNLIEAAPIQMDRCDAEEVKGGDVGEGKNQLLKLFGYILGLQFKNLILANRKLLLWRLHIREENVVADNPYFQRGTKLQKGCQIDYLIQTNYQNLYAVEVKFSQGEVDLKVIEEMKEKIIRLKKPQKMVVLPVLIHVNGVKQSVKDSGFFYEIIDFSDFLSGKDHG